MPKQRNSVALDIRAKYSNNVCPICWMPLCLGEGETASRWRAVQMAFKGKPAFSIRNPPPGKGEVGRPIKAFGISRFTGCTMANYEQCHYVHFSMFGEYSDAKNLWYGCSFNQCEISNNVNEPVKKQAFYDKIRVAQSIFRNTVGVKYYQEYIRAAETSVDSNWNVITLLG